MPRRTHPALCCGHDRAHARSQADRYADRRFRAAKRRLGAHPQYGCIARLSPLRQLDVDERRALAAFLGEDATTDAYRGIFVHPDEARNAPRFLIGLWPFALPRNA